MSSFRFETSRSCVVVVVILAVVVAVVVFNKPDKTYPWPKEGS